MGFPDSSVGKESTCNVGDLGLIPGLERFSGEGKSYPLQYSCLEKSMDKGAWRATVHGVRGDRDNLGTKPAATTRLLEEEAMNRNRWFTGENANRR